MSNPDTAMTLDQCVAEVLAILTGQDLQYDPRYDRYQVIARLLNRALRSTALEKEWSYYSDVRTLGTAVAGSRQLSFSSGFRIRQVNDDAVRLVDSDGRAAVWAYFLPRDSLHKYVGRAGLWCAVTRNTLTFSRAFHVGEHGLEIEAPIMREPEQFYVPVQPEDPNAPPVPVAESTRNQEIDFPYPDLIILRAAFLYAQSDPVMQPRVQTIEAQYKDLMYQVIERDDRMTDSPFLNDFDLGISGAPNSQYGGHRHPHADERR